MWNLEYQNGNYTVTGISVLECGFLVHNGTRGGCVSFLTAHLYLSHILSVNGESVDRAMETECHSRLAGIHVYYSESSNLETDTGYPFLMFC